MAAKQLGDDLTELVGAAIKVSDSGTDMAAYLRWNFCNLLAELHPDELTAEELMACNVVLAQALSRKLSLSQMRQLPAGSRVAPLAGRPPLRIVPGD